jgi:hypothetical protein
MLQSHSLSHVQDLTPLGDAPLLDDIGLLALSIHVIIYAKFYKMVCYLKFYYYAKPDNVLISRKCANERKARILASLVRSARNSFIFDKLFAHRSVIV